ncbi:MAG: 5'-3' exonuclease H3TH domain-containing protein, partial [Clostridia bacterium]
EELASQLEPMKKVLTAMNIPIVEMDGLEADDIIGTLAKKYKIPTFIVTGDKDSLQLIDESTTVLLTKKGVSEIVEYDTARLAEDGLTPSQVIDLKSLMGDAGDNIPGVAGIGEKTAMMLLGSYKTLDGVYENIDKLKGKMQENLVANKDIAYLSYKLATIKIDAPIEFDIDSAILKMPFDNKLKDVFKELEFFKLAEKMSYVEGGQDDGNVDESNVKAEVINVEKFDVVNAAQLEELINKIAVVKTFAMSLEQDVYISLSKSDCYKVQINDNLLGDGVQFDEFVELIKPLLEDSNIVKLLWDSKTLWHQIEIYNVDLTAYEDIALKAYMCDANRNYKNLGEIASAFGLCVENASANLFELNETLSDEMKKKEVDKLYYDLEL